MEYRLPKSLIIQASGDRLDIEQDLLDEHFPQFDYRETKKGDCFDGWLEPFTGNRYGIRVRLKANHPRSMPDIIAKGWKPIDNPHIYSSKRLCIMKEEQWKSFMSVAFAVAKTAVWLNKYEIYRNERVWPGAEQHMHGPMYDLKKWWKDL